jgi:hypothetical protein
MNECSITSKQQVTTKQLHVRKDIHISRPYLSEYKVFELVYS